MIPSDAPSPIPAYLVVNAAGGGGRAERRLRELAFDPAPTETFVVRDAGDWARAEAWIEERLARAADSNAGLPRDGASPAAVAAPATRWIAAGGDGTAHSVLNLLLRASARKGLPDGAWALGFLALGSSNDYHKRGRGGPRVSDRRRVDFAGAFPHDLLEIRLFAEPTTATAAEPFETRFSALNFSFGTAALGNAIFNEAPWARKLKRVSADLAIAGAAIGAFLRREAVDAVLEIDGEDPFARKILNFGAYKNPHFSGSFRYDLAIDPRSGDFGVAWVDDASLFRLLRIFASLARGRFLGLPAAHALRAKRVVARFDRSRPVEIDGEIARAARVEIRIPARKAWLCP